MRFVPSVLAGFGLALVLSGCATESQVLDVQVDASSSGAPLSRSERLCFSPTPPASRPNKPATKEHQQELISVCSEIARTKGLEVVPTSAKTDCVLAAAAATSNSLTVEFATKGSRGLQTVHTVDVATFDTRPSEDTSAHGVLVALCRAAFQDYPEDLRAKAYAAGTEMPHETAKNQLVSDNCQPAPTYIWQIPRLRCTQPDGEVCVREYDRVASAADCTRPR